MILLGKSQGYVLGVYGHIEFILKSKTMKNSFFHITMLILSVGALMAFKSEPTSVDNSTFVVLQPNELDLGTAHTESSYEGKDYRFMVEGEIKRFGNASCGMMIQTPEGLMEVIEMPEHDFKFKIGQELLISFETLGAVSACGADKAIVLYDFDLTN